MSARLAVRATLPGRWEPYDAPAGVPVLRWRLHDGDRIVAAASLEALTRDDASPTQYATAAASAPGAWQRIVEVDDEADRVVVLDLVIEGAGGVGDGRIRREAAVTSFHPDHCLQLRLATRDLLLFPDLGESVRELADALQVETVE